jgi:endonuclease/exonuclease/phosphatase family metal-dependent hydrolase
VRALFLFLLATICFAQSLTVASLNLAMVKDAETIVRNLRAAPGLNDADILFLQEVVRDGSKSVADDVAVRLGRFIAFASPDGIGTVGGLAILSRYPVRDHRIHPLKPQNLIFRSRKRIALAVTIVTPDGPVRLINAHLDTRINPAERLAQLRAALDDASCFFGPTVIGGDLNTNDMQWVSNVVPIPYPGWQASRVRILMESRGFRTPFQTRRATFKHFGMQLDWIYTNGLDATAYGIEPIAFSDHHAIWVRLVTPSRGSLRETERSRAARPGGA